MYIVGRVGGTPTINGHSQAPKTQYAPPPRQKDADGQRFAAQGQAQTGARPPAVKVTLSPEAQKALADQKAEARSPSGG